MSDTRASGPHRRALPVHRRVLPVYRHALPIHRRALPVHRRALPVQVDALPVGRRHTSSAPRLRTQGQEACICHAARIIYANGLQKYPCFTKIHVLAFFAVIRMFYPVRRPFCRYKWSWTPQVRLPVLTLRNSRVLYIKGQIFLNPEMFYMWDGCVSALSVLSSSYLFWTLTQCC